MVAMDLAPRINEQLTDSARAIVNAAEGLAAPIAAAAQALVKALLADAKILACGAGPATSLAAFFVATLMHRFEAERPPLAAVALGTDAASFAAIAAESGIGDVYARQVRAIGRAGDVLLVLGDDADAPTLIAAIDAAHAHDMIVVAILAAPPPGSIGLATEALARSDIQIVIRAERAPRLREIQLVVLHAICEGIDTLLIGGEG